MPTTYAIPNGRTVMDATAYTGAGGTSSFTNNDNATLGFKPDLVWIKGRSNSGSHSWQDSVRGAGSATKLSSNSTNAENNNAGDATDPIYGYLSSFDSNGFTVVNGSTGGQVNGSGVSYVAWQWQAGQGTTSSNTNGSVTSTVSVNATAGFSVVTFTQSGSGVITVGHGLGAVPSFYIIKQRTVADNWFTYHISLGNTGKVNLNTTSAFAASTIWNNTSPTSTVFTLNTSLISASTMVAYCWTAIPGFSAFGSYVGNANADGPFVYTGFRPKCIIIKNTINGVADWTILDTTRDPYNLATKELNPDLYNAESTANTADILSNGFKLRSTYGNTNGSGQTMIYAAFAENPFKYANAR